MHIQSLTAHGQPDSNFDFIDHAPGKVLSKIFLEYLQTFELESCVQVSKFWNKAIINLAAENESMLVHLFKELFERFRVKSKIDFTGRFRDLRSIKKMAADLKVSIIQRSSLLSQEALREFHWEPYANISILRN